MAFIMIHWGQKCLGWVISTQISFTQETLNDFHGNEAKKNSGIGPWVSRIDSCKGIDVAQPIWCRLSDVSSKTLNRQKIFFVFKLFLR